MHKGARIYGARVCQGGIAGKLLEMTSPEVTPTRGSLRYEHDRKRRAGVRHRRRGRHGSTATIRAGGRWSVRRTEQPMVWPT